MTPAQELRAAAARLRETPPPFLAMPPRLVMTDAETVSGVAFCEDHQLPDDAEHRHSACDNCDVIDCLHESLAGLLAALLAARGHLADGLHHCGEELSVATMYARDHDCDPFDLLDEPDSVRSALAVARALLGEETTR